MGESNLKYLKDVVVQLLHSLTKNMNFGEMRGNKMLFSDFFLHSFYVCC